MRNNIVRFFSEGTWVGGGYTRSHCVAQAALGHFVLSLTVDWDYRPMQ